MIVAFIQITTFAQESTTPDGKAIANEVRSMMKSFNEGNADDLIEKTHPAIFKLAGGKKNFKEALRSGAKQIIDLGIEIESSKIEIPKDYHQAGEELVCFVPKVVVMVVDGKRVKSTSFMIAARRGEQKWRYLDGAGLRRNPDLLWTFFPDLDKNVSLPENTVEVLNTDVDQNGAPSRPAPELKSEGKEKPEPEPEGRPQ